MLGLGRINYRPLADFVTAHAAALDELFVQVVQVLMHEKRVALERVAHDGTKIRAAASASSFKRQQRLAECRRLAEEHRAIYRQRGPGAEFSHACLKEKRGLRKYLRRGLPKVRAETAWACLSCHVAIWIRRVWKTRRPAIA